jgi:AAHS family 4-hydroxybenzoate transporter-like MFS transporter
MPAIDLGHTLDEGRWSPHLKFLVGLTAVAIVFDGIDNQLLAVAIPALIKQWGLARADFAPVLTGNYIGLMLGGSLAGLLGDRLGRKSALVLSVLSFAVFTLATAAAQGLWSLGLLRFAAAVGLGGAIPNSAALASEFSPRRHRSFSVTLVIVCIPVGGMAAAELAARILPVLGWRGLFALGGALPLVGAALLWQFLAESPRYLVRRPNRWPELTTLLRRAGHAVPDGATFTDSAERPVERVSLGALFVSDFRRDTVALWLAMFACMLAFYVEISWIPTLLAGAGWANPGPSNGIFYFNLGGVFGALIAGRAVAQFGSRVPMIAIGLAAAASAGYLASMPMSGNAAIFPVLAMLTVIGGLINAQMVTLYALAANVYPVGLRATGVGATVSFGRLGAVASPALGAAMMERGGYTAFFCAVAIAMALCAVGLVFVHRHISRTSLPV